jgi:type I restriction enzyme R subunit
LTKKVKNPTEGASYPRSLNTAAKRALYDNVGKNEGLALAIDAAVIASKQDDWRSNTFKIKMVRRAIKTAIESYKFAKTGESSGMGGDEAAGYEGRESESTDHLAEEILELVRNQHGY